MGAMAELESVLDISPRQSVGFDFDLLSIQHWLSDVKIGDRPNPSPPCPNLPHRYNAHHLEHTNSVVYFPSDPI